jgi:hypothetical protein
MRSNYSPCEIIAVRVSPSSDVHAHIPDGVVSGVKKYFSRFAKESHKTFSTVPSITELIVGAITLCNDEQELIQLANANHSLDIDLSQFSILDFTKYAQLIDIGYKAGMEQFQYWQ